MMRVDFIEFFGYIRPFNPIEFVINGNIIYNDYDGPRGEYDDWERVIPNRFPIKDYKIIDFKVEIVLHHHSVIYINCERVL